MIKVKKITTSPFNSWIFVIIPDKSDDHKLSMLSRPFIKYRIENKLSKPGHRIFDYNNIDLTGYIYNDNYSYQYKITGLFFNVLIIKETKSL
jgi:hypothetical protein